MPQTHRLLELSRMDVQERYKLLIGSIVPRPIALVSTVNREGQPNLAPFSFFMGVGANPPAVAISPMRRGDGSRKDTLRNIEETGQFVVNCISFALAEAMNRASADWPQEVDEFAVSELTPIESLRVRPPRVAESPIQFECQLLHLLPIGEGPLSGTLVVGQVLVAHVREELYEEGRIRLEAYDPIGRLGGSAYVRVRTDVFELPRPGPEIISTYFKAER
jgi:flavin reductase (DIM6/NTAB) family NADH-FMN oxidoreductase RutF